MSAAIYSDPAKVSAGVLALLVHALFFLVLYGSFSWQMKPPQGLVVDIWDSLPEGLEEPPVAAQPEKSQPAPKPEPAVQPSASKAEIEIRNKKKLKEEKLKQEQAAAKKLAQQQVEQAERRMEELTRQAQSRAQSQAQRKAQEEAAIASGKVVDEYIGKIAAKIRRFIVLPPGVDKNIRAEFNVTLLPGGEVLSANLARSSGNEPYDNAVERAILKAQPLPLPPAEKNLFNRFRDLRLKFSPAENGQ